MCSSTGFRLKDGFLPGLLNFSTDNGLQGSSLLLYIRQGNEKHPGLDRIKPGPGRVASLRGGFSMYWLGTWICGQNRQFRGPVQQALSGYALLYTQVLSLQNIFSIRYHLHLPFLQPGLSRLGVQPVRIFLLVWLILYGRKM